MPHSILLGLLLFPAVQDQTRPVRLEKMFVGHRADLRDIVFAPDGKALVTSSVDSTIRSWRVPDGAPLRVIQHPTAIASMDLSSDGGTIATGSYDGRIRLWRAADGTLLRTLDGHGATVWSVKFSPDGQRLASTGEDRNVRLWRVSDGAPLRIFRGHRLNVWSVAWTPDGRRIASSSFDHDIRIWDAESGALVRILTGHTQAVVGIAINRDGSILASGSDDSSIRLWRMSDGMLLRTIEVGNHVYKVAFSPDGHTLAGAGRARGALGTLVHDATGGRLAGGRVVSARLWRVDDGSLVAQFDGHTDSSTSVAFSADGSWLATGSLDGSVALWSVRSR